MAPTKLSDTTLSTLIGGLFTLLGVWVGVWLANQKADRERTARRKGITEMIAHEIRTNVRELKDWKINTPLPVRSNYLWDALRSEVPDLLTPSQVTKLADFYYQQAKVYKVNPAEQDAVTELLKAGNSALNELGKHT